MSECRWAGSDQPRIVPSRRLDCWRNRVVVQAANLLLRLATPEYRRMAHGAVWLGLETAAQEPCNAPEAPQSIRVASWSTDEANGAQKGGNA